MYSAVLLLMIHNAAGVPAQSYQGPLRRGSQGRAYQPLGCDYLTSSPNSLCSPLTGQYGKWRLN